MSEVRVLPVPEGSIVWLHDIDFTSDDEFARAKLDLHRAIGHDLYVVLFTHGAGEVEVFGSDDDFVARVRAAIETP